MTNNFIAAALVVFLATVTCYADQPFKIATRNSNDRVDVKSENDKVTFVIRSVLGIGNASIERMTERWPGTFVIQLRLKGLENFKLSTATLKLEASVSSHDGSVRLWKNRNEDSPLDSESPYWMELRILNGDGEPTKAIPQKDGCFEIKLPKKFFENNPKSLKVEWIDFYRN